MANVRLQDVAELAGVSMKTVSNVVHDFPHVSAAMRIRVEAAIAELGYRPNASARRLATGRTGMLSLAFSDVSLPYFAELARIIARLSTERGYRLLLEQTDGTIESERAIVSTREAGLVDGVIFQPSRMPSLEIAKHREDVPLVLLGEGPAPLSVDHVMIDNVAAVTRDLGRAEDRRLEQHAVDETRLGGRDDRALGVERAVGLLEQHAITALAGQGRHAAGELRVVGDADVAEGQGEQPGAPRGETAARLVGPI
jgi:hypothetical protein